MPHFELEISGMTQEFRREMGGNRAWVELEITIIHDPSLSAYRATKAIQQLLPGDWIWLGHENLPTTAEYAVTKSVFGREFTVNGARVDYWSVDYA
jgi:hypothetical protein